MMDEFDAMFSELLEKGYIEYVGKRTDGEPEYRLTAKVIEHMDQLDFMEKE